MFSYEMWDESELAVMDDGEVLHSVGAMDVPGEVELITTLVDGICQQGNNLEGAAEQVRIFFRFLHAFDGMLTLGELVTTLEKVTSFLAPVNQQQQ